MNECKALYDLFEALDLVFVVLALERSYGRKRIGRHPRSLLGQFKTELLKRVVDIEGYAELYRLIDNDKDLRTLCDIRGRETVSSIDIVKVAGSSGERETSTDLELETTESCTSSWLRERS